MTKKQMADILVNSPAWDGEKNADVLCANYSKQEIQDAYNLLYIAEQDYYEQFC